MAVEGVLTNEQFPCPPGNLPWTVAVVKGPALYTPVTPGAVGVAPTGGQAISKEALGLPVSVIWAGVLGSLNGQYTANVFLNPATPMSGSQTGIILQWLLAATMVEVGAIDLSAQTVRILAIGR